MMNNMCDAEVGSVRKGWHRCNRRVKGTVQSKFGLWLDYCIRHLKKYECRCNTAPYNPNHYHSSGPVQTKQEGRLK